MKVLATPRSFGKNNPELFDILRDAGLDVVRNDTGGILSADRMCEKLADCDGLIVGVDPVDATVLAAAPRLRAIAKYGVGLDNIDLAACEARGIKVSRTVGANSEAVADYALALMLGVARKVALIDRRCRERDWSKITGIDLYGNMPLIEPLEYKETDRVRDFAIVIDTSESVSGDLVRRFITHTFDILKSSQDYATTVNIHVIQCDAKVQSDLKITDLGDVDKLMEGFVIRGFGGTDFRPAFDYVEMLRKRGEFADLKGLIYFTDGLGQFPEKTPDYDAAFVFMDEEGRELPPVPPWAMKVVVDEAGLSQLDSRSA